MAQLGRALKRIISFQHCGVPQTLTRSAGVHLEVRCFGSTRSLLQDEDKGTVGEILTKSTKTAIKESNVEDDKVQEHAEEGRKQSPEVAEMEKAIKENDDIKDSAGVKPELQTAD